MERQHIFYFGDDRGDYPVFRVARKNSSMTTVLVDSSNLDNAPELAVMREIANVKINGNEISSAVDVFAELLMKKVSL